MVKVYQFNKLRVIGKKIIFISIISIFISCQNENTLLKNIPSSYSGIHFNNKIIENDSINVLDIVNVYNGGGVGIGDFNNDGFLDIYFTGNMVSNKLYLNKGGFKFEDVTDIAKVSGDGKWGRGISVIDINNDGLLDMYVCNTISKDPLERENILYVNQGLDKNQIPHFSNLASEYGLNDTTHSTMANFFDYDNDGDLDMYLTVNVIAKGANPGVFKNSKSSSFGRLYRNDWSSQLGHPIFSDVSKIAGMKADGYGHSASIADINRDGWKDIYITNDFLSDNILYINNHNGTFSNMVKEYFKHTSNNSMGADIIDINNDGLQDLIELDMNPEDNFRKKTMMNGNNYHIYQNFDKYGHQYQYVRNTLQLNQGAGIKQHDSITIPVFSDISYLAGIAETDWSWAPVVTDFDNDGFRDIIITNGFPKDVTDHDFITFRNNSLDLASKETLLEQIPEVKLHNYAYLNNGDLTFTDVTNKWGLSQPTFSNGAAYADFDNDGALDLVINNINDEASIYQNTSRQKGGSHNNHFLEIKLIGDSLNFNGLGANISIYYNKGKQQFYEQTPYRGYLSTIQLNPHFGLGTSTVIDSLVVSWPDGKTQRLENLEVDKTVTINILNAYMNLQLNQKVLASNPFFTEVTDSLGMTFLHKQNDFIDFDIQKLLPHKLSEYGPALAAGDLDGNGLDDLIIGGSASQNPVIFLQQKNGIFNQKQLSPHSASYFKKWYGMGLVLFDADNDGDLDLYMAGGGYEFQPNTNSYRDLLFVNNGKGDFKLDSTCLPHNFTSKSCVRVADFDKDGDMDIFVGGRVKPWNYPLPVSSYIYRNDSKNGIIKFTDITSSVAKPLINIGLVCDALWTDFNNDGWQDLILAGEWMPLKFLKNNNGIFEDITVNSGIENKIGWWNSLVPGDFDNDGDIDYIAGNLGVNTFYIGNEVYPISIYFKDFDNNGIGECIPVKNLKDKQGVINEYTTHTRDDVVDPMPFIKKRFLTYKAFGEASFDELFTSDQISGAVKLKANYLKTSIIRNKGNGKFEIIPLPISAQMSSINGMIADDMDGDGNLDLLLNGNDFGTEVSTGRYDAFNGLFLKGDGKGSFSPLSILQAGFFTPGNAKALVKLQSINGKTLIATSENRGPLKVFIVNKNERSIPVENDDISAVISFQDGGLQIQELNYGSSFLSQSSRFIALPVNAKFVTIENSKGEKRVINFK